MDNSGVRNFIVLAGGGSGEFLLERAEDFFFFFFSIDTGKFQGNSVYISEGINNVRQAVKKEFFMNGPGRRRFLCLSSVRVARRDDARTDAGSWGLWLLHHEFK